jgi:hypothetical protein
MSRRVFRTVLMLLLMSASPFMPLICSAQDAGTQLNGAAISQEGYDPAEARTAPIANSKETSHSSVTERFLSNLHSPIGFSMGVFELYVPNASGPESAFTSNLYTMVRPRVFMNTRTQRFQFQADYSFGYRRYNHQSQIHSSEHSAMIGLTYDLSRRLSLHISDDFRSTFNDGADLPSSSTPVLYQPRFAQGFYVPGERSTTNSLVAGVTYRAGKRSNVTVFGGYDLWRYGASTIGAHGIQAGIRMDLQIGKWIYLDSSYSHYLNVVPMGFQSTNIHRLQAGGFKLKPWRSIELYVSGGADSTRFLEHQRTTGSIQGGLARTSGSTLFSLVYHRGFAVAVGPNATVNGHIISASVSQWLSRRINIEAVSGYTRGFSLNRDSKIEYLGGNAELQIVVQRHVLFSTQYSYVSQRATNFVTDSSHVKLYTVTTGLQFVYPSLDTRERSRN